MRKTSVSSDSAASVVSSSDRCHLGVTSLITTQLYVTDTAVIYNVLVPFWYLLNLWLIY